MAVTYRVTMNSEQVRRALADPNVSREPILRFLRRSAFTVEARAKEKAPVDRGRLRNSISHRIDEQQVRAVVFAGVNYAADVEFGMRPHWPPVGALQPWARRHGFPAGPAGDFLVRRAIARRGTKAQPFMKPALDESLQDIEGFLELAGREIEQAWGAHGDASGGA